MALKMCNRVTFTQLIAVVNFMEKHPSLARGTLKSLEGRTTSKRLYHQLSLTVNAITGAKKSPKGWAKYWADKKFSIKKAMFESSDGTKLNELERRIYEVCFSCKDEGVNSKKITMKKESECDFNSFGDDDDDNDNKSLDQEQEDMEPTINFEEQPMADMEERQAVVMEKLVKVMGEQSSALTQLAQASQIQARAMDRLADASQLQARALDRLANTFENIGGSFIDVRNSVVGIDTTMKRYYNTPNT